MAEETEICIMCNIDMDVVKVKPGTNYRRRIVRYKCRVCGYECLGRTQHEKWIEDGKFDSDSAI